MDLDVGPKIEDISGAVSQAVWGAVAPAATHVVLQGLFPLSAGDPALDAQTQLAIDERLGR